MDNLANSFEAMIISATQDTSLKGHPPNQPQLLYRQLPHETWLKILAAQKCLDLLHPTVGKSIF